MIENDRYSYAPADAKLASLEQSLGLQAGALVSQAQLQRTPGLVREVLCRLTQLSAQPKSAQPAAGGVQTKSLDAAFLSGLLQRAVDQEVGNVVAVGSAPVPLVNRVAAGYPRDFTDLSYPRGVADDYVQAPTNGDPDAFAARVFGDSMEPRYHPGDIVVFSPAAAFRSGDDCFVRFEDGNTTFKRVYLIDDPPNPAVVRLVARNSNYPPVDHPADRVAGIYRAIYCVRSIEPEA